ncbi:heme o synthase [Pseudomonas sp. SWRI153]|uniref:Protoheme IX farnesyltransferase n=1 Tax=Pseudomonas khorasanensis TaxID=2745508 RepID=A0A923JCZ2_9PSED|nr:heme o synthase [Pseudomonas khorasanensis]MBV4484756.1 heme o synthase [Pseudomonas khorasanensis]
MDHEQHSPQHAGALKQWRLSLNVGLELTKPGIIVGNLASVFGGYLLAASGRPVSMAHLLAALLGTALVIACGCVINNCVDRDIDRRMVRTCHRALAVRAVSLPGAFCYAAVLGLIGFGLLWAGTTPLACAMAAVGLIVYAGVYTCLMKRRSHWGTLVGSLSGAMPPVVGYCAVTASFDATALMLIIVFCCWQMPHSHAITVMRHEDFRAAGLPTLTLGKARREIKIYMAAFLVSAVILGGVADINVSYPLVIFCLGGYWFYLASRPVPTGTARAWARRIFSVSIVLILALNLSLALNAVLPSPAALYRSSGVLENHQTLARGGLSESVSTAPNNLEEIHG